MKISAYNQIQQIANERIKIEKTNKVTKSSKDKLDISTQGDILSKALKAVKESPDVREDKVNEIKERIKNNTYEVSIDDFLDKLIK